MKGTEIRASCLLWIAAALCGCGAGSALDSLEMPSGAGEKPAVDKLAATYTITPDSVAVARRDGGYDDFTSTITLKADGTVSIQHLPDCANLWDKKEIKKTFRDVSGTWRLGERQGYWIVLVSEGSSKQDIEIGLWNHKPPYRLWFLIGDMDAGHYLDYDLAPAEKGAGKKL